MKKKKLGKLALLRRKTREQSKQIDASNLENSRLLTEVSELRIQLEEARRRTIPLGDGSDLNFLPLCVDRVEIKHDFAVVESLSGLSTRIPTSSHALIHARGDMVYYAPPSSTSKKAPDRSATGDRIFG